MNQQWLAQLPIKNIKRAQHVGGGDINQAYHLITVSGDYFLLVQPGRSKHFYDHEIEGLHLLSQAVNTPKVIANGEINGDAYLIISYIEAGQGDQFALGQMVARLHQVPSPNGKFGYTSPYDTRDYELQNTWMSDWAEFFLTTRLEPMKKLLEHKGRFLPQWQPHFTKMAAAMRAAMKTYHPQAILLHGDLWAGNYMFDTQGTPYLIDPSVYYGDREYDIALTTVFGGYDARFYAGYQSVLPLEKGVNDRLPFYRLYYLMMHTYLFGVTYQSSVDQIISQY